VTDTSIASSLRQSARIAGQFFQAEHEQIAKLQDVSKQPVVNQEGLLKQPENT
jgi:hypothetical protein